MGEPTTLTDTGTAGTDVAYLGSWGDDSTGNAVKAVDTYAQAGTYPVVDTASNSLSLLIATKTVSVHHQAVAGLVAVYNSPAPRASRRR